MKRLCFLNSRLLGSYTFPQGELFPRDILWYCQTCGEIYARLPVVDKGEMQGGWLAWPGCCEKHSAEGFLYNQLPGSVWSLSDSRYNEQLPEEVLKRELEIAIKHFEEAAV